LVVAGIIEGFRDPLGIKRPGKIGRGNYSEPYNLVIFSETKKATNKPSSV